MIEQRITLTREQIEAMPREQLSALLLAAHKVEATAVVRDIYGNIKYDRPELAGTYGEEYLQ